MASGGRDVNARHLSKKGRCLVTRRTARRTAAVGAVVIVTLTPALVASAAGPTGDAATIAYVQEAVANTNIIPAYQDMRTGYTRIVAKRGGLGFTLNWASGTSQFVRGYFPTSEKIILVQSAGKIVRVEDTLTPIVPQCHTKTCSRSYPMQFVESRSGTFEGVVSSRSTVSCYEKVSSSPIPNYVGNAAWRVAGNFLPMVTQGNLANVTVTWSLGGRSFTEQVWIDATTKLFIRDSVTAAPGSGKPGFTYHETLTVLPSIPAPPKIVLCKNSSQG